MKNLKFILLAVASIAVVAGVNLYGMHELDAAVTYNGGIVKAFTAGANVTATLDVTTTNTNPIILVYVFETNNQTNGNATSVTIGTQAATRHSWVRGKAGTMGGLALWYLYNPPTGSQTVTVSTNATGSTSFVAMAYGGASQSAFPDSASTTFRTANVTSLAMSLTSTKANGMMSMGVIDGSNAPTAGSNTTLRGSGSPSSFGTFDNGTASTTAGTDVLNASFSSSPVSSIAVQIPAFVASGAVDNNLPPTSLAGGVSDSSGGENL